MFTFIYILIFTYLLGGYISIYLKGVGREAWGIPILLYRLHFVNTIYIYYTYYPPTLYTKVAKIAPLHPVTSPFNEKKYAQYTLYEPFDVPIYYR